MFSAPANFLMLLDENTLIKLALLSKLRKDGIGKDKKNKGSSSETEDYLSSKGNPEQETVYYHIGGTMYEVETSCGGSELLAIFKNTHQALMDEKVWERVQELRANRRRPTKPQKQSGRDFLISFA